MTVTLPAYHVREMPYAVLAYFPLACSFACYQGAVDQSQRSKEIKLTIQEAAQLSPCAKQVNKSRVTFLSWPALGHTHCNPCRRSVHASNALQLVA